MNFKVYLGPEAYQEIQEEMNWYDQQGDNLRYKFRQEIGIVLRLIQNNPYF